MTTTPKGYYPKIPDDVTYLRLQDQALRRRAQKQSLHDIGHDLRIHPVTLRKMLGLPVGGLIKSGARAESTAISYSRAEKAWAMRVAEVGPVLFR